MSTLKVDAIRHNSATSDAITMATDGTCTAKLTSVGGGQISNRNLVINGAMNVAQRGTSFTTNGVYGADRWRTSFGAGGFNTQQVADAPVGFKNSIKVTQTSYGSASYKMIEHYIEGNNIISLGYGAAGAKTATLSFFVKGSVTGTYGVTIQNAATGGSRVSYVSSYTINSANTWEFKTVTVTPPTTYTWYTDHQRGLGIIFSLGSTGYSTSTLNQWQVANKFDVTGAVDLSNNSGATLQITGVQYEVGDTATSFEHRSYADELMRCMRYYEHSYNDGIGAGANSNVGGYYMCLTSDASGNAAFSIEYKVRKRTAPVTAVFYADNGTANQWDYARNGASGKVTVNYHRNSQTHLNAYMGVGAGWTVCYVLGHWTAESEL